MKLFNRFRFSQELKRRVRENAALGKPLSIMDDLVFKAMLSSDTEDSREALRSLLSACTRREVSTVCVTTNEPIPAHLEAKAVRLDVNVTFNDGEAANLEMQFSASGDDLIARAVLYAAMLQSSQSRKGGAYKRIRRVYQIFFLNLILFPDSDKLPRRYSYREEIEHDLLTEAVEIIFYELPKLERRVQDYLKGTTGIECLPEDEKWCMYMKYRHEERAAKLIERLYREEEGIMRAEKTVSGISRDYLKAIREMNILKNRMDRASEQDNARQEGLQTGRAEKAMEIARKMKKVGDSAERIQDITGLSPEDIEKL
jgi:predicted transposase/invertase (TIGR01784 family)